MASPTVDIATGITVVFGTTGFSMEIMDVGGPSYARDPVEITHQLTVKAKEFTPADLYDGGEFTFSVHYNPDSAIPVDEVPETITVTWPAGATVVFTGFMTGFDPTGPLNDKMTADATLKVSGEPAITPPV